MNKYTLPKIRKINLNNEQAVLQVCQIGGAYFRTQPGSLCYDSGPGPTCPVSVKGSAARMGFSLPGDTIPS